MKRLLRIKAAGFALENAYRLDTIQAHKDAGTLSEIVTPVEEVFSEYPVLTARPEFDIMLKNGNKMTPEQFLEQILPKDGQHMRVYMSDGRFAAVYEYQKAISLYRPSKMFLED